MPFVEHSDVVNAMVKKAYQHGFVVSDFDWGDWAQSAEAKRLHDDETALAGATSIQLSRLFTLHLRQDRFVDGALLEAFNSGLMLRIVRRAAVLAAAPSANRDGKE